MTEEELRLWWHLRNETAHKWRRQEPLGRFIADFVCYEVRVIVEVDGSQHGGPYDEARDAWLMQQGFEVLRFGNDELNHHIGSVIDAIVLSCDGRTP